MSYSLQRPFSFVLALLAFGVAAFAQNEHTECSELELGLPRGVIQDGTPVTLLVKVTGGTALRNDLLFDWSVSSGMILDGQGTEAVTFKAVKKDAGASIKISVSVRGLPANCRSEVTDVLPIAQRLPNESLDSFGKLKPNDLRARLDAFFTSLADNPQYEGVLVISFTTKQTAKYKRSRMDLIYSHIVFRRFVRKRISFYVQAGPQEQTVVWQIPDGFDYSDIEIDETKLLKADGYLSKRTALFPQKRKR